MKKIGILHLRASNFVGGPERQVLRYAGYEQGGTIETIIGSFVGEAEGKAFLREAESRGFATLALGHCGPLALAARLATFIRENNVAVLCTHGYKATIIGLLARRKVPVAVVPFLRGWTAEDPKVKFYEWLERRLLPTCDRIVCLSENQQERVGHGGALAGKVRVVTNVIEPLPLDTNQRGVARRDLLQRFELPEDAVIIASAGRLSPEKGTEFFIQAIPRIAAAFPKARFLIFGSGPKRARLGMLAVKLGVADRVRFAGLVAEFPSLVRGVDLVVNPSLTEEMPNVLLEAMAVQVPVIATAVGGVPELTDGGRACCMVPARDADAIAASAITLLQDPRSLASLGLAGHERVQTAFSPQRQKQQLRSLYNDLLPWLKFDEYAASHSDAPFLSVVMPVRNEEEHVGETLQALLDQDYPANRYEILVADGNSTDGTRAVVETIAARAKTPIHWLTNPGQLSSAGRNVGMRAARGEVITIIDGHCEIPGRHLLADTARLIHEQGADALCRPQPLLHPGNSWFQDLVARVRATALGHGRDSTIYSLDNSSFVDPTSSGATYRREVFDRIGYFDENFDACEDVEFNYRVSIAGLKAFIDPSLAIFYRPRHDFRTLFLQLRRYGKGRAKFLRKHPKAWSVAQLLPAGVVIATVVGLFGLLLPGVARIMAMAPLSLYLLVVIVWSVGIALRHGIADGVIAVWVYLTIHFGLGLGFLSGVLTAAPGRSSPEVAHRRQVAGRN